MTQRFKSKLSYATPYAKLPLAVLVDHGSASSSEIVAGALQARGRAPLVGTKTFGKGIVQDRYDLADNSGFTMTTRYVGLPTKGRGLFGRRGQTPFMYHAKGLTPNVAVPKGQDALSRATELLSR